MKFISLKTIAGLVLLSFFARLAYAEFAPGSLPPIICLLLCERSLAETPLEKVLRAYDDPLSKHIFIAAHRGGRENDEADRAPGNSIANIDNALSQNFDIYESDIEILANGTDETDDDVLVVFHDPDFNNLTNSTVPNDLLFNRNLSYAKSLFLTYSNGAVSTERIPTLSEFLAAAKGKIMLKFDPKFFDRRSLNKIYDAVLSADMVEQVLLRVGGTALANAQQDGYDTRMLMRRYNTMPSVEEINSLINSYDIRAISVPNGADNDVLDAANAASIVVEIHELQGASDQDREAAWQLAIEQGYRQFHSFKASLLLQYLDANNDREF